jgi:asparagine synthase (glutamine-hydrolysing)
MCGIAGIFRFDHRSQPDAALLARMTELIAHRGPDDSGHLVRDNVALGHRRLSIIDLSSSGHQPMSNDDGSVWIVYNGECYNYAELGARLRARGWKFRSSSDTEVILRLYEERGEAFLADLDGMFAFALWDRRKKLLLVARDRIGIKPLYWTADRERFLFASELKALLADPEVTTDLDEAALGSYFRLLSIPDPNSIFTAVRKLRPGHYLRVSPAGVQEREYWKLAIAIDPAMPFETACRGFGQRFATSVRSHMVADVPVGAFLSGGVDSSSIVATAAGIADRPVETFSITFPGLDEFDESPYAAEVANHCGTHHHEFNLTPDLIESAEKVAWHADEPFAISSAFALYHLAKLARSRVKVVLTGDGGDEAFAGYVWRHVDFPELPAVAAVAAEGILARFHTWLPDPVRRHLTRVRSRDERYLDSFTACGGAELDLLLQPELARAAAEGWEHNEVQRHLDEAPGTEQLARKLYADIKTTLVSEMLTKVDRMTMAHGLEARVPFLDHHLVEWAFTVPARHKLQGAEGKLLVKKAMSSYLPDPILYRRKQGFNVPMRLWMRGELRDFIHDNLAPSRIRRRGLLRPEAVTKLVEDHFSGAIDGSNRIYSLLMLELWHQHFVDRRGELAARGAGLTQALSA